MNATPDNLERWGKLADDTHALLCVLYEALGSWDRVDSYVSGAVDVQRWKSNRPDLQELDTDPDELAVVFDLADYRTGGSDD